MHSGTLALDAVRLERVCENMTCMCALAISKYHTSLNNDVLRTVLASDIWHPRLNHSTQATPRAGLNSSEARLNKPEPEGFLALAGQVDALVSRPADQVLGLHVKLCRANQGLE